jgi:hypothetical protein
VLISSPLFNQNESAQAIDAQPGGQPDAPGSCHLLDNGWRGAPVTLLVGRRKEDAYETEPSI